MNALTVSRDEALLDRIARHTGRRVIGLVIEWDDEVVILRGTTSSFHVKQLALHAVGEVLPGVMVRNAIQVTSDRHSSFVIRHSADEDDGVVASD